MSTKRVSATLSFGFKAGPQYRTWSKNRRKALKDAITADLAAKLTDVRRISWGAVPLEVDNHGTTDELKVQEAIERELMRTADSALDPYVIRLKEDEFGDPEPVSDVTYVWKGGRRVCLHGYVVSFEQKPFDPENPNPTDWVVDDPDERAQILAQLAWETPL